MLSHDVSFVDSETPQYKNISDVFRNANSSIKLNDQEMEYIKYLLNDTNAFNNIDSAIKDIMSDGKLDFHDLPQIVVIVSNMVHLNYSAIYNKIDKLAVVQYILDQIIDSGILPLPAFELPIIKRIIDSSIELLKMNLNKKTNTYCKKLFCCWSVV